MCFSAIQFVQLALPRSRYCWLQLAIRSRGAISLLLAMANLLWHWLADLFLLLGRGTQALCKEQTFAQIYVRSLFKLAGYHLLHRYPYRPVACSPGPVLFCLACLALSLAAITGNLGCALVHLPGQKVSRIAG